MSYRIDDIARILATPMPRRQAFRLLTGTLAGGVLGSLGIRSAFGQATPNATACRPACPPLQTCCTTGTRPFCASRGQSCCGNYSYGFGQKCCTTGTVPFVVSNNRTCCGNGSCFSFGQMCCTTGSSPFCASTGNTCCGNTSCQRGDVCCNGTCCSRGQSCVNGRCTSSKA